MIGSKLLLYFSLLLFFISFAASSSSFINNTHKCSTQQASALLQFKENLSSINDSSHAWECHNQLSPIMNWIKNTDCCKWNGVTCNYITGDVIGMDLSCGMLRGNIHPDTTLFHLPHLQTLNLAYNDFTDSKLPHEISRFSNSLTHLNISQCGFIGEISSEILLLPKLVSLDLSQNWNTGLRIRPSVLNSLLRNSTHLRELLITNVHTGWVLPAYLNISSSLKSLNLRNTGLRGNLPCDIFSIQYLEILDLSQNDYLIGPLPKVNTSINMPLKWLDLSNTNLSGEIANSIGHLKSLNYLDLSYNNFIGEIPYSIGRLKSLKHLDLSYNNFSGEIPESIGYLKSLRYLQLYHCRLVGSLPNSLVNLRQLVTLYLASNMLNGTLPSFLFTLPFLENILLGDNMFSGGLPSEFFKCRSLKRLSLWSNQFDGEMNKGSTLPSFIELMNLNHLDLSWNNFKGLWELETMLSSLPNLQALYLSNSGLSVVTDNSTIYINPNFHTLNLACSKLNVFPKSLQAMKNLRGLDLSGNNIGGDIPDWAGEIGGNGLIYLDLSNNSITGLPQFHSDRLMQLYLQSNKIQGPFPPSICNMSTLEYLDISDNRFDGVIPQCIENIVFSLRMIDLGNNLFHGTIPNVCVEYGELEGIVLKGNQFEGEVPTSLSKCQHLKVLDIGNNHLNGTFPEWLGYLPWLQVLVLKSNNFHGHIRTSSTINMSFPLLQVLDLSHNGFVGHLPQKYFQYFNAMKDVVRKDPKPEYLNTGGMYYSIIVVVKGQQLPFPKILVDYTIVNLSGNKFEGQIPNIIGTLNSLIALNLSHNNLNGRIPHALGYLSKIESLDLSWNQFIGEIPRSLADITTLAVLNVSQNHLVGRIPQGTQFNTFEGNSFGGNLGLCGFPLPKQCEHPSSPQFEVDEDEDEDEDESGFTWKVVMLGYGCGTLPGLLIGYVMLSTRRPKWFNAIVDSGEHIMIQTFKNKRSRTRTFGLYTCRFSLIMQILSYVAFSVPLKFGLFLYIC
ncbi:receptor-like protein 7 [Lactuca sativa]|uniref:receptor-like protein 7 n=1 Tax=Lactuca sativa TaxID=4236 RepID=UPI000CD93EAA|nr:receptor-like protein 7 [Lactuca sativa]